MGRTGRRKTLRRDRGDWVKQCWARQGQVEALRRGAVEEDRGDVSVRLEEALEVIGRHAALIDSVVEAPGPHGAGADVPKRHARFDEAAEPLLVSVLGSGVEKPPHQPPEAVV